MKGKYYEKWIICCKRCLTFLGGDYMNDLQIQQYKEKVAKSLVRNGYYTSIKDAIRSIEGILKK